MAVRVGPTTNASYSQVLVPTDISGFTVLDELLGIEIAILAVTSLWVQSPVTRASRAGA